LPEDRKNLDTEVDQLQEMADRLEGDLGEDEAVDILEEAVERVERFGKRLEEERK
jgi:exonuclease VII small subunit